MLRRPGGHRHPRDLGSWARAVDEARWRRAARAIERVGLDCPDGRALRGLLLAEIRRHVPFQAHAWVLTDPATEVGSDPLADVPGPLFGDLPLLIKLKYSTPLNRWTALRGAAAGLHAATGGRLERAPVWRQLLSKHGVSDVASVVFRDRFGCWAFLDLWRVGAAPPFAAAEIAYLGSIAPAVTSRLRALQAATFAAGPAGPVPEGPAVLILSPELGVRAQSADTAAYLRALLPPDGEGEPVPAGAYNVGAQLIAREAGVDAHPPRARVHLGPGTWLSLSAARMAGSGPAPADIAVTIEPLSAAERLDLFGRAHGLSRRESELVAALAGGADTREAAARLHVSGNTVQDHLKSIFAKTGARSRRALLGRALGS